MRFTILEVVCLILTVIFTTALAIDILRDIADEPKKVFTDTSPLVYQLVLASNPPKIQIPYSCPEEHVCF